MLEITSTYGTKKYVLLFDIRNPLTKHPMGYTITPQIKQIFTLCKVTINSEHDTMKLVVDKTGKIKISDPEVATALLEVLNKKCAIKTTPYEDGYITIQSIAKPCKMAATLSAKKVPGTYCDTAKSHYDMAYTNLPCVHDTMEPSGPTIVLGMTFSDWPPTSDRLLETSLAGQDHTSDADNL